MKLNTDVKVTFNPKSKVREINSHREQYKIIEILI